MKKYLIALTALMAASAGAQEIDLTQEAISDIELDYKGAAVTSNRVGVYSDLTYWNFFAVRYRGWNGGDGAYSTTLPDGNTLWTFADSHFGLISENRERKHSLNNRPHSAAMIQTGEQNEDDFLTLNEYAGTSIANLKTYYKGKEWIAHPRTSLTEDRVNEGEIAQDFFFRPDDATLLKRAGKPVVQVILGGYSGEEGRNETAIAEFSLEGTTGEEGYMQLTDMVRYAVPYVTDFGYQMLEDDGHVYLYGRIKSTSNFGGSYPVVARSASLDLRSPWEYYVKDADGSFKWQREVPSVEQLRTSGIVSSTRLTYYSVFRYGGKYYMCYQDTNYNTIWIASSDTPYGPFSSRKRLFNIESAQQNATRVTVHPQLSRMGELVISYNVDPVDITVVSKGTDDMAIETLIEGDERNFYDWVSADLDQTHFLRVFNWQTLFNVENVGPIEDAGMEAYVTTSIDDLTLEPAPQPVGIYDLQGRLLAKDASQLPALGKGIYIVNGRKVAVK
ncbi:MAG: DUF5005 domain-containing protein [Prevotella sp.]|nr:DUF5005 domain-containing protein [Prevotella sp.]